MEPKISVIVPVYKVEQYLHRCVVSILSQSFTDFELILVDDGSPDNCGKICDEYAQKDSRVRVFHKPNGGVSSARNLGLDNAKGEWVTFIDSDDYVEIDYLQELYNVQADNRVEYVVTLRDIDEIQGKSMIVCRNEYSQLFAKFQINRNGYVMGKLYKTDIINSLHLRFNVNIHLGEDCMFALQYLLETKNVVLISSDKYFYEEERSDSLTKKINPYESELAGKEEFERIVELIKINFNIDAIAITELEVAQKLYIERVIISVMRLDNKKDRLQKLRKLDLTLYNKHRKPYTWKECILLKLLKHRMFFLYDVLINLKK